jgi:hypothetical protein
VPAADNPGAFLSDGRYFEEGDWRHRGHIDGLVRALVRQRRQGRLSVELAVRAIEAASATEAFPSVTAWEMAGSWPLVPTTTGAEEAVKREGRGIDGHWCGERWLDGPEHLCTETGHRAVPMPSGMVQALVDDLSWPSEPSHENSVLEMTSSPKPIDETYFGRRQHGS